MASLECKSGSTYVKQSVGYICFEGGALSEVSKSFLRVQSPPKWFTRAPTNFETLIGNFDVAK